MRQGWQPAALLEALVGLVQVLHGGAVADADHGPHLAVRVQLLQQAGLRGHLLLRSSALRLLCKERLHDMGTEAPAHSWGLLYMCCPEFRGSGHTAHTAKHCCDGIPLAQVCH